MVFKSELDVLLVLLVLALAAFGSSLSKFLRMRYFPERLRYIPELLLRLTRCVKDLRWG
jgi:hypothetical protein